MSNILYKYRCVTARVLQYSIENTKNTSSKKTCKCPAGCTTAHDTLNLYPLPSKVNGRVNLISIFHRPAHRSGCGPGYILPACNPGDIPGRDGRYHRYVLCQPVHTHAPPYL